MLEVCPNSKYGVLNNKKTLGLAQVNNRIREIRLAAGMSADELARAVGTSQQQIGRLESGQRRLTTDWMEKLAQALGVPPADLLSGETRSVAPTAHEIAAADGREVQAIAAALLKRGMKIYRVTGDSVSESHPPGSIITVDETLDAKARVQSGQVVVLAAGPDRIKVLRTFIAPRLLVTNRRGTNTIQSLDNPVFQFEIVGVVID